MNENSNLSNFKWEYRETELSTIRGSVCTVLGTGERQTGVEILRKITYFLDGDPKPHRENYWFSFDLKTGLVSVDNVTFVDESQIEPATEGELAVAKETLAKL